jgi:hypothetical protein
MHLEAAKNLTSLSRVKDLEFLNFILRIKGGIAAENRKIQLPDRLVETMIFVLALLTGWVALRGSRSPMLVEKIAGPECALVSA